MEGGFEMKIVGSILAIIMLLGAFFGVYRFLEGHYALATELKNTHEYAQKVEKRLDFKISDDQRISFQKERREIEERNLGQPIEKWDKRDRIRYEDLGDMLDRVKKNIEKMM
jgi:hypothetical protein